MEIDSKLSILLGFCTVVLFGVVLGSVIYKLSFPPVSHKQYMIIFHEPIPGLERNSKVTLQGIAVGRVSRIELQKATAHHSFQARVWITILPDWADRVVLYQDASPRIREIGNPLVATPRGLAVGDVVRKVTFKGKTTEVAHVYQVERLLKRIYRRMLDHPTISYAFEVERNGNTVTVPLTGRVGQLDLLFSNVGTRATLQTNFVTNIQHIELSGGSSLLKELPSLGDLASKQGTDIETFITKTPNLDDLPAVIPTASTAFGRIIDKFEQKIPLVLAKVDTLLTQANGALGELRHFTQREGDLEQLFDTTSATIKEGKKLLSSINKDENVPKILAETEKLVRSINGQFARDGGLYQAIARANEVLENAKKLTAKDGPLTEQLNKVQTELRTVSKKITGTLDNADKLLLEAKRQAFDEDRVRKLLTQLDYAIRRDLRNSLNQISTSMKVFEQTMVQMQSNPDSFFLGKRSSTHK